MRAPVLGGVMALCVGCGRAPGDSLAWRECWEIVGLAEPGGIIDARVTIANTGLLRGQGHLRLDRVGPDIAPIQYARDSSPEQTTRNAGGTELSLAGDTLLGSDEGRRWRLRVRGEELNAVVEVRGTLAPPDGDAAMIGGGQWTLGPAVLDGRLHGWLEAGKRGGRLDGHAVVLRRGGDGVIDSPRTTVTILGDGLSLGVDTQGPLRIVWASVDGERLSTSETSVDLNTDGSGTLVVKGAREVRVAWWPTPAQGHSVSDPYEALTVPERLAVDLRGPLPLREVVALLATVEVDGTPRQSSGLLIHVGDDALALKKGRRRRAAAAKAATP